MLSLHPKNESRFSRKLETLFWWIVRLAPVLAFLFCAFSDSGNIITIGQAVDFCSENGFSGTLIYEFFYEIFNSHHGYLPLIESQSEDFYNLISWFALVEIARLMYDVLIFIPRLARKWINMACQED